MNTTRPTGFSEIEGLPLVGMIDAAGGVRGNRSAAARLALAVIVAGSVPWTAAVHAAEPPSSATLDELLVTGERPGPGMWRISQGDHDLWILATLEPLPKRMTWRSDAVDARIATSKVVLAPPRVDADVGFFRGLTLLPSLLRARKSPDGKTLEQELPHDLYIRWLALRVKYLGNGGGDEQLRPIVAAIDLYLHALDQSGLTSDETVWAAIERTAKKAHVPIEPVTVKLPIADPRGDIRELDRIPPAGEIACLRKTVDRLETDLQPMRQRANLWSLGDIAGLRAMPYPDEQITCLDALFSAPKLREQFLHAQQQVASAWLGAAAAALGKNDSSFAVLPITQFLKPDGLLAQLRAKGYAVQEP